MRKHCEGTLSLFPHADLGEVQRGDIFSLGRHRLACIDATNKADVARLFDGHEPTLLITSPPYADARDYNDPIPCWDSMMLGALEGHDFADDVQILVNLGVIHKKNEWVPYWYKWSQNMRKQLWRLHAQYVWAKPWPLPGAFGARLLPSHEFIFHINKKSVEANKWLPTQDISHNKSTRYDVCGRKSDRKLRQVNATHATRVPSSVISVPQVNRGESTGHPAQMPIQLAAFLIRTWRKKGCLTYDPFGGSGTTLLACEQEDVNGLGAEMSPAYVQLAIDRWRKVHPDKPVTRVR